MNPHVGLSRNELESLCLKAARGAGLSWGLAEETGSALGWLAAHGIDGTAVLLHHLTAQGATPWDDGRPVPMLRLWRTAKGGPLCPITAGASLLDCARLAAGPFEWQTTLAEVAAPLLLLPFLARAAQIRGRSIKISWPSGHTQIGANGQLDHLTATQWAASATLSVTLAPTDEPDNPVALAAPFTAVRADVLDGLSTLALRTTVPATEASRKGAGSTTVDDD